MVIMLGLAAGLAVGAPLPALAVLGLAVWQPVWALGAVLVWGVLSVRHRGSGRDEVEAAYLQAVASELRAGSSLRYALSSVTHRAGGLRLDQAGVQEIHHRDPPNDPGAESGLGGRGSPFSYQAGFFRGQQGKPVEYVGRLAARYPGGSDRGGSQGTHSR